MSDIVAEARQRLASMTDAERAEWRAFCDRSFEYDPRPLSLEEARVWADGISKQMAELND